VGLNPLAYKDAIGCITGGWEHYDANAVLALISPHVILCP